MPLTPTLRRQRQWISSSRPVPGLHSKFQQSKKESQKQIFKTHCSGQGQLAQLGAGKPRSPTISLNSTSPVVTNNMAKGNQDWAKLAGQKTSRQLVLLCCAFFLAGCWL